MLKQLKLWSACEDGYDFAKACGATTFQELWERLERPDWMIWVLRKHGVKEEHKRPLQFWALECAKDVEKHWTKKHPNDNRVRECLEATEGYLNGTVTLEELREKRAYAAADAAAAAYAAYAAAAAADAAAAPYAYAAYAAYAAADAAAARMDKRKKYADSLRKALPNPFAR